MSAPPPLDMAEEMSAAAVKAFEEAEAAEIEQTRVAKAAQASEAAKASEAANAAEAAEQAAAKAAPAEATQSNAATTGLFKKMMIGSEVVPWNNPDSETGKKQIGAHDKILKYYGMESLIGEERMKMLRAFYHGTCQTHQTILQSAHCEPVRAILQTLSMRWLSKLVPDETQATLKMLNDVESEKDRNAREKREVEEATAAAEAAAEAQAKARAKAQAEEAAKVFDSLGSTAPSLLHGNYAPSAPYLYYQKDDYIHITTNDSTRALCADLESMRGLQDTDEFFEEAAAAVVKEHEEHEDGDGDGDDDDEDPNDSPSLPLSSSSSSSLSSSSLSSSSSSSSSSATPTAQHANVSALQAQIAARNTTLATLRAQLLVPETLIAQQRQQIEQLQAELARVQAIQEAARKRAEEEYEAAEVAAAAHAFVEEQDESDAAALVKAEADRAEAARQELAASQQALADSQQEMATLRAAMDAAVVEKNQVDAALLAAQTAQAALVASAGADQASRNEAARQVAEARAAVDAAAAEAATLRAEVAAAAADAATLQAAHDTAAANLAASLAAERAGRETNQTRHAIELANQKAEIDAAAEEQERAAAEIARLDAVLAAQQQLQQNANWRAVSSAAALAGLRATSDAATTAAAQASDEHRAALTAQAAAAQAELDAARDNAARLQADANAAAQEAEDLQAQLAAATREAAEAAARQTAQIDALTTQLDKNQLDLEAANERAAHAVGLATQRRADAFAANERETEALARVEASNRLMFEKTTAASEADARVVNANARIAAAQEAMSRQKDASNVAGAARNRAARDAIAAAHTALDAAQRDMRTAQEAAARAEEDRAAAAAQVKISEDSARAAAQQVVDMKAAAERAIAAAAEITAKADRRAVEQTEHITGLNESLERQADTLAQQEEAATIASQQAAEQATQLMAQLADMSAEARRLDSELRRLTQNRNNITASQHEQIRTLQAQAAQIAAQKAELANQHTAAAAAEQLAAQRLIAVNEAATQLVAQQAALDELNAQLAAERAAAAADLQAQLAAQKEEADARLKNQQDRAEEAMATVARLEQEREEALARTNELEEELSSITNTSARLTSDQAASIDVLEAEKAALEVHVEGLERARNDAASAAAAASADLPPLRHLAEQLKSTLTDQAAKVTMLEAQLAAQRTNANARVANAQAAASERVAAADAAAAEQRQRATDSAARAAAAAEEIEQLQRRLAQIQQAQEASGTQTDAQLAQIAEMEARLIEQKRVKTDADQKAVAAKARANAAEAAMAAAEARVAAAEAAMVAARANADARRGHNVEAQRKRNANAENALTAVQTQMAALKSAANKAAARQDAQKADLNAVAAQRNQLQAELEARNAELRQMAEERAAHNTKRNAEHAAALATLQQNVNETNAAREALRRQYDAALRRGQNADHLRSQLEKARQEHAGAMADEVKAQQDALAEAKKSADEEKDAQNAAFERQREAWAADMEHIERQNAELDAKRAAAALAAYNAIQEMNRIQAAAEAAAAEMKAVYAKAQQNYSNTLTASQRNKNDAIAAQREAERNAKNIADALTRARAAAVNEQHNAREAAQLAAKAAAETVAAKAAQEQLQRQQQEITLTNQQLQNDLSAATDAQREAAADIEKLKEVLTNTTSRANTSKADRDRLEAEANQARANAAAQTQEAERLQATLEQKTAAYEANLAKAERNLAGVTAAATADRAAHIQYRAETTEQLQQLQAELARTQSELSQLGPHMKSLQQQLQEASRSHNGNKTADLEQQITELEAKRKRLHEQRDRVIRHLDTIHLNPITSNSILPRNSLSQVEGLVQHLITGPFMTWRAFLRHPIALRADDLRSMKAPSQNDNGPRAVSKRNVYACLEQNRFVTMFSPLPDDTLMQNLLGKAVYAQYVSHIVDLQNSDPLDHVGADSSSSSASILSMRIDFLLYYLILALRHPYMKDGSKEFSAIEKLRHAIDTFTQRYVAVNTKQLDDIRRTCGVDLATEHSEDPPLLTFLFLTSKTPRAPNARFTHMIEPTLQRTMTMTYNSMPEPLYNMRGDKIQKVDEAYKTTYGYGPFTKIYGPMMPNNTPTTSQMISEDPTFVSAVEDRLRDGQAVTVIGYGASGSGKTTTLVYAKHNQKPGILAHVANRLIQPTRVGSGFTSCNVTIYELDADLNPRSAGSASSDEKCHTFLSEPRGGHLGDQTIDRTVLVNTDQPQRIAKTHQIHTATCDDAGSFSYGIYQDQQQNKMWGRMKTQSEVSAGNNPFVLMEREIIEYIDTKRNTAPTPNNPNSSRSHVICVLTFSKAAGDTRGEATAAVSSASASSSASSASVANAESSDAVFIVCDFAGVENTFMCGDPNVQDKIGEDALVDRMVQGTDESVKRFMQQNSISFAQEDCVLQENVSSYLFDYDPTYPRRDPPENEQYSWTSETIIDLFNKIEQECTEMYNKISGFYKDSTQKKMTLPSTLQDFKNYKNVTFNTYGQSLLGNKMGDMYRFSDSYLRILNLYRADPNVVIGEIPPRGHNLQSIWQILRLIVWYTHSPIRIQTLYQSLMTLQYTNARTIMTGSEILSFPKRVLCEQRVKEGVFINRSLAQLRSFISTTVRGKNRNPPFMEECEPFQCLPHHLQCFGQGSTNEGGDGGPLMKQIRRHTLGKTNTFCIFTVVNLSLDANNPPPTPYIDISPLLQIRDAFQPLLPRIPLSTQPTMDKITEALRTVGLTMDDMDIKDEDPIAQDFIAYWNRIHNGAHNETDVLPLLEELIQKLIAHNAITTIGTIEFTDSMAKYGATQLTCVIPDSSTVSQLTHRFEQGPAKVKVRPKAKKVSSEYAHTISSALKRVNDGSGVRLPPNSRIVVAQAVASLPLPSAPMVGVRPLSASVAPSAAPFTSARGPSASAAAQSVAPSTRGPSASAAAPSARSGAAARGTPVSTPRLGPGVSGKLFGGRLPTRAHRKANRRTRKKRNT